ncbi:hypothetical protein ACQEVM_37415 [Streptomyces sp. CA-243310]
MGRAFADELGGGGAPVVSGAAAGVVAGVGVDVQGATHRQSAALVPL